MAKFQSPSETPPEMQGEVEAADDDAHDEMETYELREEYGANAQQQRELLTPQLVKYTPKKAPVSFQELSERSAGVGRVSRSSGGSWGGSGGGSGGGSIPSERMAVYPSEDNAFNEESAPARARVVSEYGAIEGAPRTTLLSHAPRPQWEEDQRPQWEEDQRPQWEEDQRPQWEEDQRPHWEEDQRPHWEEDQRPHWEEDQRPQWEEDQRPQWEEDHRPHWEEDHRPQWEEDHRSQWQEDHRPQWEDEPRPQWEEDPRPQWEHAPQKAVPVGRHDANAAPRAGPGAPERYSPGHEASGYAAPEEDGQEPRGGQGPHRGQGSPGGEGPRGGHKPYARGHSPSPPPSPPPTAGAAVKMAEEVADAAGTGPDPSTGALTPAEQRPYGGLVDPKALPSVNEAQAAVEASDRNNLALMGTRRSFNTKVLRRAPMRIHDQMPLSYRASRRMSRLVRPPGFVSPAEEGPPSPPAPTPADATGRLTEPRGRRESRGPPLPFEALVTRQPVLEEAGEDASRHASLTSADSYLMRVALQVRPVTRGFLTGSQYDGGWGPFNNPEETGVIQLPHSFRNSRNPISRSDRLRSTQSVYKHETRDGSSRAMLTCCAATA